MFTFTVNLQHLYTALTEVAAFRTTDKSFPAMQAIRVTIDRTKPGMWIDATDRFRALSARLSQTCEWVDIPKGTTPDFAINPDEYQAMIKTIRGYKKSERQGRYITVQVEDGLMVWTVADFTNPVDILSVDAATDERPILMAPLLERVANWETHARIPFKVFGGSPNLVVAVNSGINRPHAVETHPDYKGATFRGLVTPIREV